MSDELMARATEATTEEVVEVNEADFSPEADQARMEKLHASLKGEIPDAEEPAPTEEPEEDRGPDGKFKAKDEKAAAAKPKDKPADEAPLPGALGKARRLMREATTPEQVDEACRLAFGMGVEDLKFNSRQWDGFKKRFGETKEAAAAKETAAVRALEEVRTTAFQLIPLSRARDALQKGDALQFLKLLGSDPDTFQRTLITQMTGQQPVRDPELQARIDRMERAEQARITEAQRLSQENDKLRADQGAQKQRDLIQTTLSESQDPRFVKAATKPAFIKRCYELQCENFTPPRKGERFGTTITEEEAAETAWEELYGGVVDAPATAASRLNRAGRVNPATTGRGGSNGASGRGNATTNVRQAQAAETAPDDDDSTLDYTDDNARRAHEERLQRRLRTFEQSNA